MIELIESSILTASILEFEEINLFSFIFKLAFSTFFGGVIAFHTAHAKKTFAKNSKLKVAKAQMLMCLAGTILAIVIGDSIARAFGLFGIGSFIRFRTVVEDAVNTATLLILIALGMAIGLGLYLHAIIVGVFFYIVVHFLGKITVKKELDNIIQNQ